MKKFLIKLISRVVGFRAIEFNAFFVKLWGVPMINLSLENLASNQHSLEKEFGYEEAYSIFYNLGKIQGRNGTNILLKKYNISVNKNDFTFFLEQANLIGAGHLELFKFNDKEGIAVIENTVPNYARVYMEKYGKQSHGVDFYLTGLIAGAAEVLLDCEAECREIKCLGKGDFKCIFELLFFPNNKRNELKPKDLKEINLLKEKINYNTLLQMIINPHEKEESELRQLLIKKYKRLYQIEKGVLTFLDIPVLITPMNVIVFYSFILRERYKEKSYKIFYDNAKEYGKSLGNRIQYEFDLKHHPHGLRILMQLIGMLGFGKVEITSYNKEAKSITFNINHNVFAKEYIKVLGGHELNHDFYIAGFAAGLLEEFFEKPVDVKEERCMITGAPACIFKTV